MIVGDDKTIGVDWSERVVLSFEVNRD